MFQLPTHTSFQDPLSYWQNTSPVSFFPSPALPPTNTCIIGAGLLGAVTGYWLARMGHDVTILERDFPAYGATGRNGGFVSIGADEPYAQAIRKHGYETAHTILQITLENQTLLHEVLVKEHIVCDYREPGHLHLALHQEELDTFQESCLLLAQEGIATQVLNQEDMHAFISTPLSPHILGGWFVPQAGLVHPVKLVQGLLEAAQRYGAQVVPAEVVQIQREKNSIRLSTTQGSFQAERILLANNAWIPDLLPHLRAVITPVRGQVLAYQAAPPLFSTGVTVDLAGSESYWQQTPDGTIILGGCRAAAEGYDIGVRVSQPTRVVQKALEQVFPDLFPHLKQLQVAQRWAGLMAFTPDLLPVVDRVEDLPQTWFVGGFSGHGMPYGLRFGQLLAEMLTSNTPSPLLSLFQVDRNSLR